MNRFQRNLTYYKSQHRTLGCKVTHMLGIPVIVLGAVFAVSDRRREAATCFSIGLILQLVGHFVYEHNLPILMTKHRDPVTAWSALVYVCQSWGRFLKGEPLVSIGSNGRHGEDGIRQITRPG